MSLLCLPSNPLCAQECCQIRTKQGFKSTMIKKLRSTPDMKKSVLAQDTLSMDTRREEMARRPVYFYDIPMEILATLKLKEDNTPVASVLSSTSRISSSATENNDLGTSNSSKSCSLCNQSYFTVEEQRSHVRSDLHSYNLKQRMRNSPPVSENDFESLVKDLDESLSGSDDASSDEDDSSSGTVISNLLKKQATISRRETDDWDESERSTTGPGKQPLVWFTSVSLPPNTYLGVYRAMFSSEELKEPGAIADIVRRKQLVPRSFPKAFGDINQVLTLHEQDVGPHIFMCMIGGGHFAAIIVALTPKVNKSSTTGSLAKEAVVVAHKTFHRYTTRRKQGGSQSANDNAKGAAHSAGAGIRRYNEAALNDEVRALLAEWKRFIDTSELQFVRATGTTNRKTLFGPYDGQVLHSNDSRIRSFPFNTRRATQKELMRSFIELTRVKVEEVDEAAMAAAQAAEQAAKEKAKRAQEKPLPSPVPKESEEEQIAALHTMQMQALIRRSKLPALLAYLKENSLHSNFRFHPRDSPQNFHAPTPLHLAASQNSPVIVTGLIVKALADPTVLNGDGKLAYDLAGDRPTRDAFRLARSKLLAQRSSVDWDWDSAHIPDALTEADIEARKAEETEKAKREEDERRMAEMERLKAEGPKVSCSAPLGRAAGRGRALALGAAHKTAEEKREEESRGLTPEMRMRLERERRARAAEERFKKMQAGGGGH